MKKKKRARYGRGVDKMMQGIPKNEDAVIDGDMNEHVGSERVECEIVGDCKYHPK